MDIDPNRRWKDIDRQLAELAEGKVVDGDPAEIETELDLRIAHSGRSNEGHG